MLLDYLCLHCKLKKEIFYHSTEKIEEYIKCQCGNNMIKQFPATSYLPETSDMHCRIHKAEKTMGTYNLDSHQLPKHRGPRMFPKPGGGKIVGRR